MDYRKSLTALLTAFALLLFAGSAAGSVDKYFSAGGARFTLQSENGYTIAVERFRRRVTLSAVHGGKSFFAATSYSVPSKVLPQRIDAQFGRFGRISVRLRTERMRKGELEEQCTGRPETVRYGVFVGTIRFRGEGGYTSVDTRHAKGQWNSGEKIKCVFPNLRPAPGPPAHGSRQVPPSLGAAQGRHRGFGVEFSGGKRRSILISAFSQERRGRISVFRNAFAEAPPASFDFAADLSSATVRPPRPFHGEASFQRTPAGPTWSGTLKVDFPGRDDVHLAGPRFESRLARDSSGSTFFSFGR